MLQQSDNVVAHHSRVGIASENQYNGVQAALSWGIYNGSMVFVSQALKAG